MLVLGRGGLMLSAVSRVAAAGPTRVDGEGYAGSSVGQWTCGPTARATYGGVGGHVRVYTDDPSAPAPPPEDQPEENGAREPEIEGALPPLAVHAETPEPPVVNEPYGFSLGAGGAGERRSFTRLACNETPCSPKNDTIPSTQVLGAGRADLGYDWRYFGMRLGVMAFQRWENGYDSSTTVNVLPDVEFRFARRAGFHAGVGFGAYDASTSFRPGGYHSLGYTGGDWDADVRIGGHLVFDGQAGLRLAASVRYSVSRVVAPGLGVAISSAEQIAPEGRVFLVFTP